MNEKALYSAIAAIGGVVIGGLTTWFFTKKHYEKKYSKIAQEEIDSVKKEFTSPKIEATKKFIEQKKNQPLDETNVAKKAVNKPSLTEYTKNIKNYINYSDSESKEDVGSNGLKRISFKPNGSIIVIEPEAFGEDEEYDQVSLTLYADGILADEDDTVINDVEGLLGEGALDRMGEYEEDALHVKNEARKCYYEILVDNRKYEKATGKTPPDHGEED